MTSRDPKDQTTTTFIWEKETRLPERAQAHQSWPPKSQMEKKGKLEIWGKAQRESTRRPKSGWGKI